jgi:hypothetical protein
MPEWDVKIIIPRSTLKGNNGEYLPNDDYIKCLIVGPSKWGKTTLILHNMLLSQGWLYKKNIHVYIYTKSLNQPECVFLQDLFKGIEEK